MSAAPFKFIFIKHTPCQVSCVLTVPLETSENVAARISILNEYSLAFNNVVVLMKQLLTECVHCVNFNTTADYDVCFFRLFSVSLCSIRTLIR